MDSACAATVVKTASAANSAMVFMGKRIDQSAVIVKPGLANCLRADFKQARHCLRQFRRRNDSRRGRRRIITGPVPVEPDALEAEFAGRDDVVKEAASHVHPLGGGNSRNFGEKTKVAERRFVI